MTIICDRNRMPILPLTINCLEGTPGYGRLSPQRRTHTPVAKLADSPIAHTHRHRLKSRLLYILLSLFYGRINIYNRITLTRRKSNGGQRNPPYDITISSINGKDQPYGIRLPLSLHFEHLQWLPTHCHG